MAGRIKPVLKVLAAIGVLSVAASYFTGIGLCLFYNLVGIPCISCGMTRAWLLALNGDWSGALRYHPLFWSVALLPFIFEKVKPKTLSAVSLGVLAIFVLVWGIRIFYMFPHTPPMTLNERAPVMRLLGIE